MKENAVVFQMKLVTVQAIQNRQMLRTCHANFEENAS